MSLDTVIDLLWTHTWWSFERDRELTYSLAYRVFNLLEGIFWLVCCGLVLVRRSCRQKTRVELWYALAFFAFGCSDFRESYYQQSWLIWFKLVNLIVLLWLRRIVMTRLYPDSKLL